jgi:hypothetical protein
MLLRNTSVLETQNLLDVLLYHGGNHLKGSLSHEQSAECRWTVGYGTENAGHLHGLRGDYTFGQKIASHLTRSAPFRSLVMLKHLSDATGTHAIISLWNQMVHCNHCSILTMESPFHS